MNSWLKNFLAVVGGLTTVSMLWWLIWINDRLWLFIGLGFFLLLLLGFLFLKHKYVSIVKRDIWGLFLGNLSALVFLFSILENIYLQWLLIIFGCLSVFFVFWLPEIEAWPPHQRKPIRRALVAMVIWQVFAWTSSLYAWLMFFPNLPFWLLAVILSTLVGFVSIILWQRYFSLPAKQFFVSGLVVILLFWELLWVVQVLPSGYLAQGLMITWLWYLGWLLLRFHYSEQGIAWRRQWRFLVLNLILLMMFLWLYVRWI